MFWHGPIGIEVFQKVIYTDNFSLVEEGVKGTAIGYRQDGLVVRIIQESISSLMRLMRDLLPMSFPSSISKILRSLMG